MANVRSGQITVNPAGTAVRGPHISADVIQLKAHPSNTKPVWVGNDGANDVTLNNGFPLQPGETCVVGPVDLYDYIFDTEVNSEKICWLVCR